MQTGFSLIELLITLVIAAILASIAYPIYTHHLIKAKRNHAKITLMHLAANLEQYYSINGTYKGATLKKLHSKNQSDDGSYQFTINKLTDTEFRISAIPLTTQAKNDTQCGILTLNETGQQEENGEIKNCW